MRLIIALVFILSAPLACADLYADLLRARYTPAPRTDPEYGQAAIERNDLPHREIARFTWLIDVPSPADPAEWQRRLNAAVSGKRGAFRVTEATEEEKRKVRSGEIVLQK